MKFLVRGDFIFVTAVLAIFIVAFWVAKDWYMSAKIFPWFAAIPGAILCVAQLWRYAARWEDRNEAHGMAVDEVYEQLVTPELERQRSLEFWGWLVLTILGIWLLGITIAVSFSVLLFSRIIGEESWLLSAAIGLGAFAFVWGFFVWAFDMAWPTGEIFLWLDLDLAW